MRYIFHLSIPVRDLDEALGFYVDALAAKPGRRHDDWLDVLVWGHQVTLQLRPEEVLPRAAQGKRHYGVVLPWDEWKSEVERIRASGIRFAAEPQVLMPGTAEEQAKFYLRDPSDNVIEVKAYRNVAETLGLDGSGYD